MRDRIVKESTEKILGDTNGLKKHNVILQLQSGFFNALINWRKFCDDLPQNIYGFIRKAIILTVPNNTNLLRWKKVDYTFCTFCKMNNQAQLHMLGNCPAAVRSVWKIWRHNSILYTMRHYLSEFENTGFKTYVDLNGFKSSTELFNRLIPDIVLVRNNKMVVIEITCCFKTKFVKSRLIIVMGKLVYYLHAHQNWFILENCYSWNKNKKYM